MSESDVQAAEEGLLLRGTCLLGICAECCQMGLSARAAQEFPCWSELRIPLVSAG